MCLLGSGTISIHAQRLQISDGRQEKNESIWNRCKMTLKVTVYLQVCLACKRCSECSLSSRYLNPHIKLNLIELAIKLYKKWNVEFFTATKCERPNHLSKATSQFNFFLGFRVQSVKSTCLRFAIFNCSKKLQNIFEIVLKKCGAIVQKSFSKRKYFEINK